MIQFVCPKCEGHLTASDEQAGTMIACWHCSEWITVPGGDSVEQGPCLRIPCRFCKQEIAVRLSDLGIPIRCPHCGEMLHLLPDRITGLPVFRPYDEELAQRPESWQERFKGISLSASWRTFKQILFHPVRFYRRMPRRGTGALPFAVWVNVISAFAFFVMLSLLFVLGHVFPLLGRTLSASPRFLTGVDPLFGRDLWFITVPVVAMVRVAALAAISHFILRIVMQTKPEFTTVFEVTGYSEAGSLFRFVPYWGLSLATIWSIFLAAVGFREAVRMDSLRAAATAVLSRILIWFVLVGLFVALGGDFSLSELLPWVQWK